MATDAYSGKYGTVKINGVTVLEITQWKLEIEGKSGKIVSNKTAGFTGKFPCAVDGKGSLEIKVPQPANDSPTRASPGTAAPLKVNTYYATVLLAADKSLVDTFVLPSILIVKAGVDINLGSEDGVGVPYEFEVDGPFSGTGNFDVVPAVGTF